MFLETEAVGLKYNIKVVLYNCTERVLYFKRSTFVGSAGHSGFSPPPQWPMTSDVEGYLPKMLSIT